MWVDDVILDDTDDELDMRCKTYKTNDTYVTICNCKYGIYSH